LAPGIQESRSFFGQNRDFFKKLSNLGVDVIQPRIAGILDAQAGAHWVDLFVSHCLGLSADYLLVIYTSRLN